MDSPHLRLDAMKNDQTSTGRIDVYLPATFQQDSEPTRLEKFLARHFYWPSGW